MGTRSTTKIIDKQGNVLLSLYCQWDGYPEGVGADLINLIKGKKVVNGYSLEDKEKYPNTFNGMGCLALWLASQLKKEIGGWYATTEDDTQEYNYIIRPVLDHGVAVECLEGWGGQ